MALAFSVSINVLEVDYHNNQLAHPELGVFLYLLHSEIRWGIYMRIILDPKPVLVLFPVD